MSPTLTAPPPPLNDDIETAEAVLETASPLAVEVQPTPTLITEQEVIFSTAAAVPTPSTRRWTQATRVAAVAMRRIFAASSEPSRPKRRDYPPRLTFLEDSRMEREMHRL